MILAFDDTSDDIDDIFFIAANAIESRERVKRQMDAMKRKLQAQHDDELEMLSETKKQISKQVYSTGIDTLSTKISTCMYNLDTNTSTTITMNFFYKTRPTTKLLIQWNLLYLVSLELFSFILKLNSIYPMRNLKIQYRKSSQ